MRLRLIQLNREVSTRVYVDMFELLEHPRVVVSKYGHPTKIVSGDAALAIISQVKSGEEVNYENTNT